MKNHGKEPQNCTLDNCQVLLCVQKSDMRRNKTQHFHKIEIGMNDRGSHRIAIDLLWR